MSGLGATLFIFAPGKRNWHVLALAKCQTLAFPLRGRPLVVGGKVKVDA